jgi:hypothetical protein
LLDGEIDLELLINDLSIKGQFPNINSFLEAIDRVMGMRNLARQFGRELHCHRNLCHAQVTNNLVMSQVIQHLSQETRSALMQWLTRHGPYWEDDRVHGPDDYLECNDHIVTDTAIGEAAFRSSNGGDHRLVSLTPSSWDFSPLSVWCRLDDGDDKEVEIRNYLTSEALRTALRLAQPIIETWDQLAQISQERFPYLTFAPDAFDPFRGHPFVPGAAQRLIERLGVLEGLKCSFDESGERTAEGHRLYRDYFTGEKAWFSDSSDREKNDFESEMTFRHPEIEGETLFCTWHGKVKTPQLRIHFSWPVSSGVPLYVVYVGPKITKR